MWINQFLYVLFGLIHFYYFILNKYIHICFNTCSIRMIYFSSLSHKSKNIYSFISNQNKLTSYATLPNPSKHNFKINLSSSHSLNFISIGTNSILSMIANQSYLKYGTIISANQTRFSNYHFGDIILMVVFCMII